MHKDFATIDKKMSRVASYFSFGSLPTALAVLFQNVSRRRGIALSHSRHLARCRTRSFLVFEGYGQIDRVRARIVRGSNWYWDTFGKLLFGRVILIDRMRPIRRRAKHCS